MKWIESKGDYLMKTKEFIKRIEDMGFLIVDNGFQFRIKNVIDCTIAYVNKEKMWTIDTGLYDFQALELEDREKLFKTILDYTATPIENRKESTKYYIKHAQLTKGFEYLNYNKLGKEWYLSAKYEHDTVKTKFSLDELPEFVHGFLEKGEFVKEEV